MDRYGAAGSSLLVAVLASLRALFRTEQRKEASKVKMCEFRLECPFPN
jgi:hypothetical protein